MRSILIEKGESNSLSHPVDAIVDVNANMLMHTLGTTYFHLAIREFWQGNNNLCQYCI